MPSRYKTHKIKNEDNTLHPMSINISGQFVFYEAGVPVSDFLGTISCHRTHSSTGSRWNCKENDQRTLVFPSEASAQHSGEHVFEHVEVGGNL